MRVGGFGLGQPVLGLGKPVMMLDSLAALGGSGPGGRVQSS